MIILSLQLRGGSEEEREQLAKYGPKPMLESSVLSNTTSLKWEDTLCLKHIPNA